MENQKPSCDVSAQVSAAGVHSTIRHLHDELKQLLHERDQIMRRIATAKKTIAGLAALFGDGVLDSNLHKLVSHRRPRRQPGLTNMCRAVLMETGHAMSVYDVLDTISKRNPSLIVGHKDPVSSLTTILNRLVDYGQANQMLANNHRRAWQWTERD